MVVFLLKAGPFIQYTKHITAVCHYGLSATSKWLRGGNRSEKRDTKESFDLRKCEWEASPPSQCLWPARCFIGLKWPHVDSIYVIKSRSLHTTIKKKTTTIFFSLWRKWIMLVSFLPRGIQKYPPEIYCCIRFPNTHVEQLLPGGTLPFPRGEEEKVCLLSVHRNSCCSWPSGLDQRGLLCLVLISNDEHSAPALPFIFAAKQTAGTLNTQTALIGIHRCLYKWLWGC